jgi:hypothetical protein
MTTVVSRETACETTEPAAADSGAMVRLDPAIQSKRQGFFHTLASGADAAGRSGLLARCIRRSGSKSVPSLSGRRTWIAGAMAMQRHHRKGGLTGTGFFGTNAPKSKAPAFGGSFVSCLIPLPAGGLFKRKRRLIGLGTAPDDQMGTGYFNGS